VERMLTLDARPTSITTGGKIFSRLVLVVPVGVPLTLEEI
jgi:hypothetical protein